MMYRKMPVYLGALALALFVSAPFLAGQAAGKAQTHEGKIVSVTGNKLVMTGKDGQEHSHSVAANADVTCDGKACKVQDLKAGLRVRVTTKKGDSDVATRIEALNQNNNFEVSQKTAGVAHYGKVVSVTGNQLVMVGKDGKEHSHAVPVNTKISCDGAACTLAELQPGWRIRVTTRENAQDVVTQVEALKNNEKFKNRN